MNARIISQLLTGALLAGLVLAMLAWGDYQEQTSSHISAQDGEVQSAILGQIEPLVAQSPEAGVIVGADPQSDSLLEITALSPASGRTLSWSWPSTQDKQSPLDVYDFIAAELAGMPQASYQHSSSTSTGLWLAARSGDDVRMWHCFPGSKYIICPAWTAPNETWLTQQVQDPRLSPLGEQMLILPLTQTSTLHPLQVTGKLAAQML